MPARFVYWMNVSVDGFIERAPGEHSGPDGPEWVSIDEELHREFNRRAAAMTLSVEGRVVRDMMDPYWPDARFDESSSPSSASTARSTSRSRRSSSRGPGRPPITTPA